MPAVATRCVEPWISTASALAILDQVPVLGRQGEGDVGTEAQDLVDGQDHGLAGIGAVREGRLKPDEDAAAREEMLHVSEIVGDQGGGDRQRSA